MRKKQMRFLVCIVLALFSFFVSNVLPASTEDAVVVAMITDLKGKATLTNDVRKPELAILSEIKNTHRVQFQPDAHAVIVYLESGQEFDVKGPAVIVFGMQQPESISGNPPSKRGVALAKSGKNIRIKPVVVARAAIVMRAVKPDEKIKLLSPSGGTTLERHPAFEWQVPQSGLKYQFELLDDTGKPLFGTTLEQARVELPDNV